MKLQDDHDVFTIALSRINENFGAMLVALVAFMEREKLTANCSHGEPRKAEALST